MRETGEATLLRIFIGEGDKHGGKPLYEHLVDRARERGLAGATILRGVLGYGADRHMHSAKILRLAEDLPMVIEIVDAADRVEAFLPELDAVVREGMVTMERVRVIAYRPDR